MQRSIAGGGTAGIERVRFLDRRPSAIGTREKPLLQFEEFFFFEPSPVFLRSRLSLSSSRSMCSYNAMCSCNAPMTARISVPCASVPASHPELQICD